MLTNTLKLKGKMAENGYTTTSLAKKLGTTKSTLSQKINNKVKFSQPDIRDISAILNLTGDEIIEIFLN